MPLGPPREVLRDDGGAGVKCQKYEDGWLYEFSAPVGAPQSMAPRAKTLKIVFEGRWLGAFEDEDTNYLTVWVSSETHDRLFPEGPPAFRQYTADEASKARARFACWGDPNKTNPGARTGEIQLVELARLREAAREGQDD